MRPTYAGSTPGGVGRTKEISDRRYSCGKASSHKPAAVKNIPHLSTFSP
ncbi:MAG TPA: hypothetical protein V6D12_08935 [Candidatus Obscuribacterales bacterium]